jgi:general secretion pathway protein I
MPPDPHLPAVSAPCPTRAPESPGFTLIEVLVAFMIAAIAFVVLFRTAHIGLASAHIAGKYEEALSRARSHLEALGTDIQPIDGMLTGEDGDGYHWQLTAVPLDTTRPPPEDNGDREGVRPSPPIPLTLYAVTVTISWSENGPAREVSLHTRRLGRNFSVGP